MAIHAKKKRINKLWIIVFSVLGLLFIASWVWLLLYFPPVSNRAEGFIKNYFGRIFNPGVAGETVSTEEASETVSDSDTGGNQDQEKSDPENDMSLATEQNTKPTIRLVIDEGPAYDEKAGACYYIVRAVVTGIPEPDIKFSKDDSAGSLGPERARVNLKTNLRTYILTATAANDNGTAMDSLNLSWGCNNPPAIGDIKLSSDIIYVNEQYELSIAASDSDSRSIIYKWTVAGGSLESDDQATVRWNTPSEADDYAVKVEVKDSDGNVSSKSISVYVFRHTFMLAQGQIVGMTYAPFSVICDGGLVFFQVVRAPKKKHLPLGRCSRFAYSLANITPLR